MRIRILGGGYYGCHLAVALLEAGHDVVLFEKAAALFSGASGANPGRLHLGFHYPRSRQTRQMCQVQHDAFMARYGFLTRTVPVNIYAIAEHRSLVDFGTYLQVLRQEVQFVECERPAEFGLENVEGAVLTGERHIVIRQARAFFEEQLAGRIHYGADLAEDPPAHWTIDCTFCAEDAERIDRFEPCITGILRGPIDRAVTIMDGPFPSLYPWDPQESLNSLTSALLTPLARCKTYAEARGVLEATTRQAAFERVEDMRRQLAIFWPESLSLYRTVDYRLGIRAMPLSGADARLVDIIQTGERRLRIRAGKIDAILHAEKLVKELLCSP